MPEAERHEHESETYTLLLSLTLGGQHTYTTKAYIVNIKKQKFRWRVSTCKSGQRVEREFSKEGGRESVREEV